MFRYPFDLRRKNNYQKRVREDYLELKNFWDIVDSFIEYSENKLLTGSFGIYNTKLKGFKHLFGYVLNRI